MTLEMILIGISAASTALWIRAEIAGAFRGKEIVAKPKKVRAQIPDAGASEPGDLPTFLAALKSLDIPEKQARMLWTTVQYSGTIEEKITLALKASTVQMRGQ